MIGMLEVICQPHCSRTGFEVARREIGRTSFVGAVIAGVGGVVLEDKATEERTFDEDGAVVCVVPDAQLGSCT